MIARKTTARTVYGNCRFFACFTVGYLLINRASVQTQVDKGKDQGSDHQDVADRGASPEGELDERLLVRVGGKCLSRIGGPTAGEPQDDVEHLQRVDNAKHEDDAHYWPQVGPGDVAECLPASCAVEGPGFVQLLGNTLQSRVKDGRVERDAQPDVDYDHRRERDVRSAEPRHRRCDDV